MKRFLFFAIAVFVVASLSAQQKKQLTGKVTDAKSNLPLAGATIILVDFHLTAISDSSGNYTFRNVPAGHTVIEVSYVGYSSIVEHIDINSTTTKNFSLNTSVIENEAVTVTAVGSATSIRKAP